MALCFQCINITKTKHSKAKKCDILMGYTLWSMLDYLGLGTVKQSSTLISISRSSLLTHFNPSLGLIPREPGQYHGLVARLLTMPSHQQPWYWLCRINSSLFPMRKGFYYTCVISVFRNGRKCKYIFMFRKKNIVHQVLTHLPLLPHMCVNELGQHWFR